MFRAPQVQQGVGPTRVIYADAFEDATAASDASPVVDDVLDDNRTRYFDGIVYGPGDGPDTDDDLNKQIFAGLAEGRQELERALYGESVVSGVSEYSLFPEVKTEVPEPIPEGFLGFEQMRETQKELEAMFPGRAQPPPPISYRDAALAKRAEDETVQWQWWTAESLKRVRRGLEPQAGMWAFVNPLDRAHEALKGGISEEFMRPRVDGRMTNFDGDMSEYHQMRTAPTADVMEAIVTNGDAVFFKDQYDRLYALADYTLQYDLARRSREDLNKLEQRYLQVALVPSSAGLMLGRVALNFRIYRRHFNASHDPRRGEPPEPKEELRLRMFVPQDRMDRVLRGLDAERAAEGFRIFTTRQTSKRSYIIPGVRATVGSDVLHTEKAATGTIVVEFE